MNSQIRYYSSLFIATLRLYRHFVATFRLYRHFIATYIITFCLKEYVINILAVQTKGCAVGIIAHGKGW